MHKGFVWLMVLAGLVAGWVASKARTTIARTAPLGYEDEEGFHFGVPSDEE